MGNLTTEHWWLALAWFMLTGSAGNATAGTYVVVDTSQKQCYDNVRVIACPGAGQPFHGQDAQYDGVQPAYRDNGDGTVADLRTGLTWQKSPDFPTKRTWAEAQAYAEGLVLGGASDWRLPTIKELYSLIAFTGSSVSNPPTPYLDTRYFDFQYPDPNVERLIDCQYWSSTGYVGTIFQGDAAAFGVNFADGRIKGYPTLTGPRGVPFRAYVRCVRGPTTYGVNQLVDNGDGTVSDLASGLMWMKFDSATRMNWEAALAHAEGLTFAGYSDWRMPNPKELQSIVDYTRAPDAQDPNRRGPAIDPIFGVREMESWCWAGTTHLERPMSQDFAVYVCFGRGLSAQKDPFGNKINVHGAGAQRSDPKSGDPNSMMWRDGFGPQRDEIRIYNYVRCVRDIAPGGQKGDLNCDGQVNFADINPFVLALADPDEYRRQFPECDINHADCNGDGRVDFGDVNPFVDLLVGARRRA